MASSSVAQKCLLNGIADVVRAAMTGMPGFDPKSSVGVQLTGTPPPAEVKLYVAVWSGGFSQVGRDGVSDKTYAATVTLTHRMTVRPGDRRGPATADATAVTVTDLAERLADALCGGYAPIDAANSRLAALDATTNGFVEPFQSASVSGVREGEPGILTVDLTLNGARRLNLT